jgi:hypothetical protein
MRWIGRRCDLIAQTMALKFLRTQGLVELIALFISLAAAKNHAILRRDRFGLRASFLFALAAQIDNVCHRNCALG